MVVNDILAVGATPQVVNAYWAVGSSEWFADTERSRDLVAGWQAACADAGVAWGGGETPAIAGVVAPGTADLAGACVGIVQPKARLAVGDRLRAGDAIVLAASSGIHANGISLARKVAEALPIGYATALDGGASLAEALLVPTRIYARLFEAVRAAGVDVHYASNITGHGWRKLMRARRELTYRMTEVPPVPEVLAFVAQRAGLSPEEAYGTFNMGAGYALYVDEGDVAAVLDAARVAGVEAWSMGRVEDGPRQVIIEPLGLVFPGESLQVRS
jgi:phosphoribosylformylglycinamidine cyclo-ligase